MIACNRCGKENQDHYKFCLGCGAELSVGGGDHNVGTMKTMMADHEQRGGAPSGGPGGFGRPAGPPPGVGGGGPAGRVSAGWGAPPPPAHGPGGHHGGPGVGPGGPMGPGPAPSGPPPGGPAPAAPPPMGPGQVASPAGPAPAAGPKKCGNCGMDVPPNFKFCGACGSAVADAPVASYGGGGTTPNQQPSYNQTPAPTPTPAASIASLTLIRPDGSEGGSVTLEQGKNLIGRDHGAAFETDGYLSPTHCELVVEGQRASIRDLDSLNGVFVRMTGEEEIEPGQIIRMGQELLRFDLIEPPTPLEDGTEVMGSPNPGYWGRITLVIGNGVDGSAYPLLNDSVTLGRERGDINFPDDGYVSGLHARLSTRGGKVYLADMGSSNGTFLRVAGERSLGNESFVLLGQQLFRLNL